MGGLTNNIGALDDETRKMAVKIIMKSQKEQFKIQNEVLTIRNHSQATAVTQQRIYSNQLKQQAKYQKDLIHFKDNNFTDNSLADITRHLSFENKINNNFVTDQSKVVQNRSFMEQQIATNLLPVSNERTNSISSRIDRNKLGKALPNKNNVAAGNT
jgi:hypothetical protein